MRTSSMELASCDVWMSRVQLPARATTSCRHLSELRAISPGYIAPSTAGHYGRSTRGHLRGPSYRRAYLSLRTAAAFPPVRNTAWPRR
jgi:hypothetical protein